MCRKIWRREGMKACSNSRATSDPSHSAYRSVREGPASGVSWLNFEYCASCAPGEGRGSLDRASLDAAVLDDQKADAACDEEADREPEGAHEGRGQSPRHDAADVPDQ